MKTKLITSFLASFLALTSFVLAVDSDTGCGFTSGGMGSMMSGAYGFGGMWLFGWVFSTLVLVALVLLIMWLVKQIQKK